MNKEFIPYTEALALKELGFDEPCLAHWYNETPTNSEGQCLVYYKKPWDNQKIINGVIRDYYFAPTYSQAFKWFREKYRLQPSVNSFCFEEYSFVIMGSRNEILYPIHHKLLNDGKKNPWEFDTYEEAELACLKKLIEIVKNK
jgi:hypothetical protein